MPEKEKESNKPALREINNDVSGKKEYKKEAETKYKNDSEDKRIPKTDLEEETQKILEMSEISLWLDNYDDIFSDFDPRPYSLRSLSDDFLLEAKKASRDKDANRLELRFLISLEHRDQKVEAIIKKRLRDHFTKHSNQLERDMTKVRNQSIVSLLLGVTLMLVASYLDSLNLNFFAARFLFVLLEPTGWFLTWFALDRIFYSPELKKTEYEFYKKMVKCEVMFMSY